MKAVLGLIFSMFLLAGCVVDEASGNEESETTDIVKVGDRLPSFSVETITDTGRSAFSSDGLTGRAVIVFFNTTCRDCQRELPKLEAYYRQHRDDAGFQLVAIAREQAEADIAAYWEANDFTMPYSPQEDRKIYNLFATLTIPRVYFCLQSGVVTWMGVEAFDLPVGE